jgi:Ribbon-helix-helix protein, copG family.
MKVVSFKVEEDLAQQLEEYARKKNMTKSEVIRRTIKSYISTQERTFDDVRLRLFGLNALKDLKKEGKMKIIG